MFATSLVHPLKSEFPSSFVGLWCKDYAAQIAPLIPRLDACHAADPFWDKSPGRGKGPVLPFLYIWRQVRRSGYDTAIIASRSTKAAAAAALAGIPRRIGFGKVGAARWLTNPVAAPDSQKPVLEELLRLLTPLGIGQTHLICSLDRTPLAAERLRLKTVLPQRMAALHPFAGSAARCVPLAQWIILAERLAEQGYAVLWFGTRAELTPLKAAAGPARPWHYLDDVAGGSLSSAAAAITLCDVFVGHDSGPLHMACALDVPCLGIYAPGEPERTLLQGIGRWKMLAKAQPSDIGAQEMFSNLVSLLA